MQFTHARPESRGLSPRTIHRFLDACEREVHSLHSFAIAKGEEILSQGFYAPEKPGQRKIMHSVSKSLTSLAVGIAVGEGKLLLDDLLVDYFRDELPAAHDPRVGRIRVRDLLVMAAGSAETSAWFMKTPGNWRTYYLSLLPPTASEPGEYFSYDTGATYMLSCIITKVTGANVHAVLKDRVFTPMEITSTQWLEDREGNTTGGWGCYMTPEDMLKIGRLLLNYGAWDGKQLVPETYMRQALSKQIDTYANPGPGWPYGYGYQFWMYPEGCFGCYGSYGQLVICSPEKDMWVTTTGGCSTAESQRLARIITETIIAESLDKPIPTDEEAYAELCARIAALAIPAANIASFADNQRAIHSFAE